MKIFFDTILSKDSSTSCHNLSVSGAERNVNLSTVLNNSLNFVQFWDVRAKSIR